MNAEKVRELQAAAEGRGGTFTNNKWPRMNANERGEGPGTTGGRGRTRRNFYKQQVAADERGGTLTNNKWPRMNAEKDFRDGKRP